MGMGSLRARRAFALFALTAAFAVPAALAGDDTVTYLGESTAAAGGEARWEGTDLWFVQLSGSKATFEQEAKSAGIAYKHRFSYDKIWKGVSVQVSPGQLGKLGALGSVQALYPVETVGIPQVTPELGTAIAQTGADIAQNSLGLTGAGVKVAIMDTGIDYDHPDLGGCFGAGCRVEKGWDLVGDAFNASQFNADGTPNPGYNPTPSPDPDPDDCHSHGTHVAGIVGANGVIKGVAPGVTFGAYRVFGCDGSTTADIMLEAMERALADGMHILNMSIGSAHNTWAQYPTAAGADALVDAGMVVVASIGNSGADGLYSAGAPGVGNKVIGTASFDNSHVALNTFTVSPGGEAIGYGAATGAPAPPTSGSLPMAKTGTPTTTNDGCSPLPAGSMAGKAVLIRRGTCTFYIKAANAMNAGAAAVVLYNNAPGRFSPTVAGTPPITIPVVAVSDAEGVLLNGKIASGPTTMTWTAASGTFLNPTAGLLSSFSSYGLNAELTQKPDIGGPGGLIRSTYPLEKGSYATISGTSMSSPHVAGAAALLKQARPSLPAASYRDVLQNSADPAAWSGNPGLGFRDYSFRQGAGMVDIDDAILSTATVSPGKLSLGESEAGPQTRTLTVSNAGSSAVTYTLGHTGGLAAAGATPYVFGTFLANATVAFSQPAVTVPAGGSASVDVTITAPASLADRGLYGGWITLTPGGADPKVLRVVYSGLKGDYQSIVHMPARGAFPALGRRTAAPGAFYAVEPASGGTYTLANEQQIPQVLLHFDHQVRRLEIEVVDAATGARLHPVFSNVLEQEYLSKNSTSGGFMAFPWDGGRLHSNGQGSKAGLAWKTVPDGQYKLNVKVLKALGDPANPAHWETWTTPTITIDRP